MHTGLKNRAAIVECAYELLHYLQVAKDVEIQHVQMMCPPSISGQSHWILEELDSVIVHSGVDTRESAVVYRTKSGSYKLGDLDLRKRKASRKLYTRKRFLDHQGEKSDVKAPENDIKLYSALWRD